MDSGARNRNNCIVLCYDEGIRVVQSFIYFTNQQLQGPF